ncbi:14480_t:CDS:2, partial [Racocetra persica]
GNEVEDKEDRSNTRCNNWHKYKRCLRDKGNFIEDAWEPFWTGIGDKNLSNEQQPQSEAK